MIKIDFFKDIDKTFQKIKVNFKASGLFIIKAILKDSSDIFMIGVLLKISGAHFLRSRTTFYLVGTFYGQRFYFQKIKARALLYQMRFLNFSTE